MEDDWDLQAVVRGCTPTINFMPDYEKTSSFSLKLTPDHENRLLCFPDSFRTRNAIEELHELCIPFLNKSKLVQGSIDQFQHLHKQSKQSIATTANSQSSSRSKRRKNQMKKVCQVPADELCSDTWSWRKYGQKPIKGSPYPRGYYRCSSSKGCLARKQVEKNRSEPTMFIVTYTGEHNHPVPVHRNSLAGTTRYHKPATPHLNLSPPNIHQSTQTTSMEDDVLKQMVEEDGDDGLLDMAVSDDFYQGLDEIVGPVTKDYFSDHLPIYLDYVEEVSNRI